jgi:hypothetical protein
MDWIDLAQDRDHYEYGAVCIMNENWQGKAKYTEETCPDVTLSIINPICQSYLFQCMG